jgi:hypothetical protein
MNPFFLKYKFRKNLKKALPFGVFKTIQISKKIFFQIINAISTKISHLIYFHLKLLPISKKNILLKDKHKGERCFILGTAPSINNQDLSYLKNEIVIPLNFFYLHDKYKTIKPSYHLITSIVGHSCFLPKKEAHEKRIKTFNQIEESVSKKTNLLLNFKDYTFIKKHHFLKKHSIFFLGTSANIENLLNRKIDISKEASQSIQSLVTAIEVAMYMGFKSIYLLGIDHNYYFPKYIESKNPENPYFFTTQTIKSPKRKFKITDRKYLVALWHQYHVLKKYAEKHNITIKNANPKSLLDVFPFTTFESLFPNHPVKNKEMSY